jgi:hypothetical protein
MVIANNPARIRFISRLLMESVSRSLNVCSVKGSGSALLILAWKVRMILTKMVFVRLQTVMIVNIMIPTSVVRDVFLIRHAGSHAEIRITMHQMQTACVY